MEMNVIKYYKVPYFRKDHNCVDYIYMAVVKCQRCKKTLKIQKQMLKKKKILCMSCSQLGRKPWNPKGKPRTDINGKKSSNWKGGKYISNDGYLMIKVKPRIECKSKWEVYRKEHIVKMEKKIGRKIIKGEIVHHLDHNKLNNKINNLFLTNQTAHRAAHHSLEQIGSELYKQKLIKFNRKTGLYEMAKELQSYVKN